MCSIARLITPYSDHAWTRVCIFTLFNKQTPYTFLLLLRYTSLMGLKWGEHEESGRGMSTSSFILVSKAPHWVIRIPIMWLSVTYLQRDIFKWHAWISLIFDSVLNRALTTFSSSEDVDHVCVLMCRGWWWCLRSWRRWLAASWRVVSQACGWRSPTPASNRWGATSATSWSDSSSYRYWNLP